MEARLQWCRQFAQVFPVLSGWSPMGMISDLDDIVEAIVYLTEARYVTGAVLLVDGGAHNGKWCRRKKPAISCS